MGFKPIPPNNLEELCTSFMGYPLFQIQIFRRYRKNPDLIEDSFSGELSEQVFLHFVQFSTGSFLAKRILPAVVDAVESQSISDPVFDALLTFPDKAVRESLVVSLSHKCLSVRQLKALCATGQCFECHFELAVRQYQDPDATPEDFREAIALFLNSPFAEMRADLWNELKELPCENPKKLAILDSCPP